MPAMLVVCARKILVMALMTSACITTTGLAQVTPSVTSLLTETETRDAGLNKLTSQELSALNVSLLRVLGLLLAQAPTLGERTTEIKPGSWKRGCYESTIMSPSPF